jgi:hypothetical protein
MWRCLQKDLLSWPLAAAVTLQDIDGDGDGDGSDDVAEMRTRKMMKISIPCE